MVRALTGSATDVSVLWISKSKEHGMASYYSSFNEAWTDRGPKNIIRESEFGFDMTTIYFPGVQSCVAVIARLQLGLCGAHLTIGNDQASIDAIVAKMEARAGGRASQIMLVGALPLLGQKCAAGSVYKYPAMVATINQRLAGGSAAVQGLNEVPVPGSDVQVSLAGGVMQLSTRAIQAPFAEAGGWVVRNAAAL
jgi:hypothetical protein